eukprot:gene10661-10820_t
MFPCTPVDPCLHAATPQQQRHAQQAQQSYSPLRAAASNRSPRHSPSNSYSGGLESIPTAGTSSGDESGSPQAASVAFISLAGSAAVESPRSPSRLRITSLNSLGHGGLQGQQKHSLPGLPNFITVEKVPLEVAEDDIQIEHHQADEVKRHADVQDNIIKQVDDLVERLNLLRKADQEEINQLRQELDYRELQLQAFVGDKDRPAPAVGWVQPVVMEYGVWAALKRSWRRHPCWWSSALFFLLALALAIALPIVLIRPPVAPAPAFLFTPLVQAASNNSLDISVAVSQGASVWYLIIPRASSKRRSLQAAASDALQAISAAELQAASRGWGLSALEAGASACGSVYIPGSTSNTTFTVLSQQGSTECVRQRVAAGTGQQRVSCSRCPLLQPGVTYDVLLAAVGMTGSSGNVVVVQATTLPAWAGTAPSLSGNSSSLVKGGSLTPSSNRLTSSVTSAGDNSFVLSFNLNTAGAVQFLVLQASLYSRFAQRYAVWDNVLADPAALMATPRSSFWHGLVAKGQINVDQGGTGVACTIGGGTSSSCSCNTSVTCTQEVACFGQLCDYSTSAVMSNTTYKVVLVPVSLDGKSTGDPVELPPFTTTTPTTGPRLSPETAVSPVIGPDRFTIRDVQQNKPGRIHVVVTRPNSRSSQDSCDSTTVLKALVDPSVESLVWQTCAPVAKITQKQEFLVKGLVNDTTYRVLLVPTDMYNNQVVWSALVHTQDLTPPLLTVVDRSAPEFDSFNVTVQLNEAGTIYAGLLLSSNAAAVTAPAACPPVFQGPMVQLFSNPGLQTPGNNNVVLSFAGLTANMDYQLRLIAVDASGNCQTQFTVETIHTLDNVPPVTMALDVANVKGTTADLRIMLDEPGYVMYVVLQQTAAGASCPSADEMYAGTISLKVASAVSSSIGNISIPMANNTAVQNMVNLTSQTSYRACVIAADATRLHNKQDIVDYVDFTTLDITSPKLTLNALPGMDGNFTCTRTNFLCSLSFNLTLNEPGNVAWAILAGPGATNLSAPSLPSPQQMLTSSNLSTLLPLMPAASGALAIPSKAPVTVVVEELPSQTSYSLLVGAKDDAPTPNYQAAVQQLLLVAPDVRAPTFTNVSLAGLNDTSVTVNVTVDENSVVYYIVAAHPSKAPTPAQVVSGQAAVGAAPVVGGNVSAAAASIVPLQPTGLLAGTLYDIYLVAVDNPAGNRQPTVTNITRVRTSDSTPPVISLLTATFTPPMTLTITANISKPGVLLYAPRKIGQQPPTTKEVLAAVATRDLTLANFTRTQQAPSAGVAVSVTACVADGDQMVVYAVANDTEGQWPGRGDNTSPVKIANVSVVPLNTGESCIDSVFLGPLQPSIAFSSQPSQSGFMLGHKEPNTSSPVAMMWQQTGTAFEGSGSFQPALVMPMSIRGVRLPGSLTLQYARLPPAAVKLVVRSSVLVPDANSDAGSSLRFTYQLTDLLGRTQVNASGITVQLLLSYGSGSALPSAAGVVAADNALPACNMDTLGPVSGVGLCEVLVERRYFPAAGSLAATVKARVLLFGTNQVAVSAAAAVTLRAPPSPAAFAPSSPGLLVTLPYRPVYAGETFKVTLQAVNPLMQGLSGFTVPLRYDRRILELRTINTSSLWLPAVVSPRPVAGYEEVREVAVADRAAGNADSAYRASSSIPLLEFTFAVKATTPGTYSSVLYINTQPAVAAASVSMLPSWSSAPYQFNSFNGHSTTGALNVVAVTTLGLWGWASTSDIFNTAVLSGQQVSASLHGVAVTSFGDMDFLQDGDAVTCASPAANAAGSGAVTVDASLCQVQVNAVNKVSAKGLAIPVTYGAVSTQVKLNIWTPSNLSLTAADDTLNSVMPINVDAGRISPSCMDMYQATPLTLTADWSNGGTNAGDKLTGADVTRLAIFQSNDTNVAQVSGAVVKGIQPGTAIIRTTSQPGAQVIITVSSEPVCLVQLQALATTGVAWTSSVQSMLGASPPQTLTTVPLSWQAQQVLSAEDGTAVVLSYAAFSDGASMDVSGRAAVTAEGLLLPYAMGTDAATQLPAVNINATIGADKYCQKSLKTSWAVCSVPLGDGSGTVAVKLSRPIGIFNFSAAPWSITGPDNDAAADPISLSHAASLTLLVQFDDGSVKDFSTDPRTTFTVSAASQGFCRVAAVPGGGGLQQVIATGRSVSGSCDITAAVVFPSNITSKPITAVTTVLVVGLTQLEMYVGGANAVSLPQPLPPAGMPLAHESLVLLKCDARNYEQRTLWSLGVLSNCSSDGRSCPRVDLNNRQYLQLNSSNTAVAKILASYPPPLDSYPSYTWLDNRLVPFSSGNTTLTATFGNTSRSTELVIKDTYQPGWPQATALSDTSALIAVNMTDAFTVKFQLLPSASLAAPLGAAGLLNASDVLQKGIALLPNATGAPYYYSAVASGLTPGTNYTLLAAVSYGTVAASPGVTVLSGLLVPDTSPPSFTNTSLVSMKVPSGDDRFYAQMQINISEPGTIFFAVYGNPHCITADPTPGEMVSGVNLKTVGKCNCSSELCSAVSTGSLDFSGSRATGSSSSIGGLVPVAGWQPPWPFADLPADATCRNYTPSTLASVNHTLYLLAQDDLPTYKNWSNNCTMPVADLTGPPGPCAQVTAGQCVTTQAPDSVNQQAVPFAAYDLSNSSTKAPPPAGQPLKGVLRVSDGVPPGFVSATAVALPQAAGGTQPVVTFTFQTAKAGLVRWWLVEDVVKKVAHGWTAVRNANLTYTVSISSKCMDEVGPLLKGTAYALWFYMTDIYGSWSDLQIMDVKWNS